MKLIAQKRNLTPPQVLALGLLVMIMIGTILLMTPFAVSNGIPLSWEDALFTATSATAVTGLVVVDTGTRFSIFGQLVILFLIQVGGLGLMTVSSLVFLMLGRKIGFKERLLIQQTLNQGSVAGVVRLVRYVILFTFIAEAVGALLLALRWQGIYGWGKALYYGIFHAVSAFCNAGFDLTSASMVPFRADVLVNGVIIGLFITGGLGFTVIVELFRGERSLSIHTKLVLWTTFVLLIVGFIGVLWSEFTNPLTIGTLSLKEKILASFFQGATPRTAGFNTVNIGDMKMGTLFLTIFLMFIGASPGSTGGGVKTTTFAAMGAVVWSIIRGKEDVELFHRRIPLDTILKSLVIILISLFIVVVVTFILLETTGAALHEALFEATSAFGTVGLSTGLTGELNMVGKLVISLTMFMGRLGPLTIAFALAKNRGKKQLKHYPEENILVG